MCIRDREIWSVIYLEEDAWSSPAGSPSIGTSNMLARWLTTFESHPVSVLFGHAKLIQLYTCGRARVRSSVYHYSLAEEQGRKKEEETNLFITRKYKGISTRPRTTLE